MKLSQLVGGAVLFALPAALYFSSTATAQAPTPIPSVWLQGASPGTAQTGNTNITGVSKAGSFIGNGAMLTSIDANNIAGTIPDGILSSNVALLDGINAFTGKKNTFAGKVGIGVANPTAKLEVQGEMIRTITRAQGYNQADGTDNGPLTLRKLNFTKLYASTGLRVTYCDNIRVFTTNQGGRWEVRFNGASAPNPLAWDLYNSSSSSYIHTPTTLTGTAMGLAAGSYLVQVWVSPAPGYPIGDLYTGWNGSWSLEVEEVW